VEIAFSSKDLRNLCLSQLLAEEAMSIEAAVALRICLADLRASKFADDFMFLRNVEIDEHKASVRLDSTMYLRFEQGHKDAPTTGDCLDWGKVYRVRIVAVGGERT
jgi:hypothetical protein